MRPKCFTVRSQVHYRGLAVDTGVGDYDVDAPEVFHRPVSEVLQVLRLGHITSDRHGFSAGYGDLLGGVVDRAGAVLDEGGVRGWFVFGP